MLTCPRCGIPAERRANHDGLLWHCPQCGGASTIVSQMRKYVPHDVVNSLWTAAKSSQGAHPLSCPSCNQKLAEISVPGASFVIDVCPGCAFVWFDSGEYQLLPKTPQKPAGKQLPPEAAQLLALRRIEDLRRRARDEKKSPDGVWKYIPALLGAPVEFDAEDVLGRMRFLFLLTASTVAGGAAYVLTHPGSSAACIGASGGISGILAYYALRFPRHRIGVLFFFTKWIRFPVTVYLGFWIFMQIIGLMCGGGRIAYEAHLGGLLTGAGFWLVERVRPRKG